MRYNGRQVTTSVCRGRVGFSEETIEPVYWAESHQEVLVAIEKRRDRGTEATAQSANCGSRSLEHT